MWQNMQLTYTYFILYHYQIWMSIENIQIIINYKWAKLVRLTKVSFKIEFGKINNSRLEKSPPKPFYLLLLIWGQIIILKFVKIYHLFYSKCINAGLCGRPAPSHTTFIIIENLISLFDFGNNCSWWRMDFWIWAFVGQTSF